MPKKPPKLRPDLNEVAFRILREATGEDPKTLPPAERTEKNPEAVKRGRKGGRKRGASLSEERKSQLAKSAANKRWGKEQP